MRDDGDTMPPHLSICYEWLSYGTHLPGMELREVGDEPRSRRRRPGAFDDRRRTIRRKKAGYAITDG